MVGCLCHALISGRALLNEVVDSDGRSERAESYKRAAYRVSLVLFPVLRVVLSEHCAEFLAHRVVRASLGAMSTGQDVDRFLAFLHETFVTREDSAYASSNCSEAAASDKLEHLNRAASAEHEGGLQVAACQG